MFQSFCFKTFEKGPMKWVPGKEGKEPTLEWKKKNRPKTFSLLQEMPVRMNSNSIFWAKSVDFADDMDFDGNEDTDNQYTAPSVYGTDNYHVNQYNHEYYAYDSTGPTLSFYNNPDILVSLFVLGVAFCVCWCISLLFCGFGCGWTAKTKLTTGEDKKEVKYDPDHVNQV